MKEGWLINGDDRLRTEEGWIRRRCRHHPLLFCALRNLLICSLVGSFFQEEGVCGGCKNKGPGAREPRSFLCPR